MQGISHCFQNHVELIPIIYTETNGGLGLCEQGERFDQDRNNISSSDDSDTVSSHELDTSNSEVDSGSMDTNAPVSLFHIVPIVEKLKLSCQFVDAVTRATLNISSLSKEALLWLHDPPQHILKIDDTSELHSLKQ